MAWAAIVVGGASIAAGAIQTSSANKKRKAAESKVEGMAASYKPNQSVLDYYDQALKGYNVSPYESTGYKLDTLQYQRNLGSGITALGNRHLATGGINKLVAGANDASLKSGVAARKDQSSRFGQLAGATKLKASEEKYPFEMMYNLQSTKAGAAAQGVNQGYSNMWKGLSSAAQIYTANKMYGGGGGKTGGPV